MANILGKPLKKFALKVSPRIARREAFQFFPNPGSKALIDDVVSPMANNTGTARTLRVRPIIEPVDLLVKIRWKSFHPWTQFFSDKLLKDFCKRIALSKILITGCLIDESDDSDGRKPVLQLRSTGGEMFSVL